MPPVTICRDVVVASALLERGAEVVLCHHDATLLGEAARDLRTAAGPGARLAVVVGDLTDPETAAAATAMARELFGREPSAVVTVVATLSAALQLWAHLPGPQAGGSGTV